MLSRLFPGVKRQIFNFLIFTVLSLNPNKDVLPVDLIRLPDGFKIHVYAQDVPNARSMALSPSGTLFVGTRKNDRVYALVDEDNDKKVDRKYIIAKGLNMPNGVAFADGALYVAEVNRIIKFDRIEQNLSQPPAPVVVNDAYPTETWHGWKFIRFGPDGKLYVPVGAPCNICENSEPIFASITRMETDGSGLEIYAQGVRNTVGFDWHPETQELWFTDNGRDMMGDDLPPDELNRAPRPGMHFGFPYCHGRDVSDPEYGHKRSCQDTEPPVRELGPHVASLGMRFYTGNMFPKEYHHQIFIAEHGSWNRSKKIGYRVMLVTLEGNRAVSYQEFASGWKQGEKVWGRPVDIQQMPDGSILVSDDHAGAIYRISYKTPK